MSSFRISCLVRSRMASVSPPASCCLWQGSSHRVCPACRGRWSCRRPHLRGAPASSFRKFSEVRGPGKHTQKSTCRTSWPPSVRNAIDRGEMGILDKGYVSRYVKTLDDRHVDRHGDARIQIERAGLVLTQRKGATRKRESPQTVEGTPRRELPVAELGKGRQTR